MRLINLGSVGALESVVLIEVLKGGVDTLLLCQPSVGIWIGKNEPLSHVNLLACETRGVVIARAIQGGGCILLDGQISYILISDTPSDRIECVVNACKNLGMPAARRPESNDVVVNDRKIAGTVTTPGLFTGNFSVSFDYDLAEAVLNIPLERSKPIREWVTSASRELGRTVAYEEAETALVEGFGGILGVDFKESGLTPAELARLDVLMAKYRSESWIKRGIWSPVKEY